MVVYAEAGDHFVTAVKKAQNEIRLNEDYLDLEFNEIRVRVSKDSNVHDLETIYHLKCELRRLESNSV
jgi:hypothetical protein